MRVLNLFYAASMTVVEVLLVTGLGSFLALESINILGHNTRKQVNELVFYVFNPALVASNLAKTMTYKSLISLWFMPVNILLTFIIGSGLGWVLMLIARPPKELKGLVVGACSAGNLGNMLLIMIPVVCKEKGTPFGDSDVCSQHGMAYATLSMAIGTIFLWSYVYNLVRVFSKDFVNNQTQHVPQDVTLPSVPSSGSDSSIKVDGKMQVMFNATKRRWGNFSSRVNLKVVFAPSTIAAIVGFVIGIIAPLRKLLIGKKAPLRVIQGSASLVGSAAVPTMTLIVGGNLLRGLKGSGISLPLVLGIATVRFILLPIFGILIVKGALHFGILHADPLYQFVLLLQFTVPPAMSIGTITQLFGAGESECSVIMLWTYGLAFISLSLWSTFYMWLVAKV